MSAAAARLAGRLAPVAVASLLGWAAAARAGAQPQQLTVTPDVALSLPGLTGPVLHRDVVRERLPSRERLDLGPLSTRIGLAAFDLADDGTPLFVLEGWEMLDGVGLVGPADVVARDGESYVVELDGTVVGVPPGVAIDGLAEVGPGSFLLSFDTAVTLPGGVVAQDEDVVLASGGAFSIAVDLTGIVPDGLDLDGLDRSSDGAVWYFSFDGSGRLGGVPFDDEDIVAWDGAWSLFYDADAVDPAWAAVDLAAFSVLPRGIFADGFESGDVAAWSAATP